MSVFEEFTEELAWKKQILLCRTQQFKYRIISLFVNVVLVSCAVSLSHRPNYMYAKPTASETAAKRVRLTKQRF